MITAKETWNPCTWRRNICDGFAISGGPCPSRSARIRPRGSGSLGFDQLRYHPGIVSPGPAEADCLLGRLTEQHRSLGVGQHLLDRQHQRMTITLSLIHL